MPRSGNQTENGKAFEYACLLAIYNECKDSEKLSIRDDAPFNTAKKCYVNIKDESEKKKLDYASNAAAKAICQLEPRLLENKYINDESYLTLGIQPDSAGEIGDVRDVVCIRSSNGWEIGLSCKHNHDAVKHSRLSATIDFGNEWFGYPCSNKYFSEVVPKFNELKRIRDDSHNQKLWSELGDKKITDYYVPILRSFKDELTRLYKDHSDVPERLVHYLLGENDFYKVITDERRHWTKIEAININGTLNKSAGRKKAQISIHQLRMPTTFYHVDFKQDSGNTIQVVCDQGWEISMRLHNASSRIEPSLKFDVRLISYPSDLFTQYVPWEE